MTTRVRWGVWLPIPLDVDVVVWIKLLWCGVVVELGCTCRVHGGVPYYFVVLLGDGCGLITNR